MKPLVKITSNYTTWWLNSKVHREDGPALEWEDGSKVWYFNGIRHREDGPAVESADGIKYWYFNGRHMSMKEHAEAMKK